MSSPARQLIGPFRLDRLLARGGMGEVYRAWDSRLERWVAVKRLLETHPSASARARFLGEAKTLARLGHPAIVQLFDLLEDGGELWIVMELVRGSTLAKLLRDGPLDVSQVLDYSLQIASALAVAHEAGIIHRDLKADNVMVCPPPAGPAAGQVKILDFGVARRLPHSRSETATLTTNAETRSLPPALLGTPRAMSPEQARGEDVGPTSDLFSFGALIYELLTGSSPFRAGSVAETLIRVLSHSQPPVRKLAPAIPKTLSDLVDQLLEKAPEQRPESATAVAGLLRQIRSEGSGSPSRRAWRWRRVAFLGRMKSSRCPKTPGATAMTPSSSPDPIPTPSTLAPVHDEVVKTLLASELLGAANFILELGDREAATLFHIHDRRMRGLLALHGGLELEKSATSLLLFDRPLPAVLFALEYHQELRQLTHETGVDFQARLGIHLGELVLRRNAPSEVARGARRLEVEGLSKTTAYRLLALARGGQTLLTRPASEMARRSTVNRPDLLEWISRGRRRKGFAEPVDLFEVRAARPSRPTRQATGEGTRTLDGRPKRTVPTRPPPAG